MNSNGSIVYTLDKTAKVSATVVDVTGKTVALLNEESQAEGVQRVSIESEKLAAGIYFARLTVDGNVYTQKFVVTE